MLWNGEQRKQVSVLRANKYILKVFDFQNSETQERKRYENSCTFILEPSAECQIRSVAIRAIFFSSHRHRHFDRILNVHPPLLEEKACYASDAIPADELDSVRCRDGFVDMVRVAGLSPSHVAREITCCRCLFCSLINAVYIICVSFRLSLVFYD